MLVVASPLAIGTVHLSTKTVAYALCCVAGGLTLFDACRRQQALTITCPIALLLALLVATLLQLVPLPAAIVATFSPRAHEIFLTTLGAEYGWRPLSLDPSATLHEAAKLAALTCFLLAATYYASREVRRRKLLVAVAAVSAMAVLIGLVQVLAETTKVLFFYEPAAASAANNTALRGPFVNPNHMGALLSLGAAAALAIGLREPRHRVLAFGATILMNIAAVLTLSRSTFVTVPLAQGLAFALERWRARGGAHWSTERLGQRLAVALVIVAAITMTVVTQLDAWRKEVAHTSREELAELAGDPAPRSKVTLWREAGELAWAYPWTGVGRGAFSQGITQFSDAAGSLRFFYAENSYVQLIADWGIPVALLVLLLLGRAFLTALSTLRPDPVAAGALAGLVALAVHDVADFSIELVGIALPALAMVAILGGRHTSEQRAGVRPIRAPRWTVAAPVAALAIVLLAPFERTAEASFAWLQRKVESPTISPDEVTAAGQELRARHPADYRVHAVVARALAKRKAPGAMQWLNDAIYLNPRHPSLHLIAAELLGDAGHTSQALVEYRLAVTSTSSPEIVWNRAERRLKSVTDLIATTKTAEERVRLAQWLSRRRRPADALVAYRSALEIDPFAREAMVGATRVAIGMRSGADALVLANLLQERWPGREARILLAHALVLDGQLPMAARILDENGDRSAESFGVELRLVEALITSRQLVTARTRLDGLTWANDRLQQAQIHELRARIERAEGHRRLEQVELEKAARLRGSRGDE